MSRLLWTLPSVIAFLACNASMFAQEPELPTIDGYVSQIENQTSFEVDGRLVKTTERTGHFCSGAYIFASGPIEFSLGDHVVVFGKYDGKKQLVRASEVCKLTWPAEKVSGEALLEKIQGKQLLVDGRVLEMGSTTVTAAQGSRHSLADAQVNDWVHYTAVAQSTGRYLVKAITIAPNTVSPLEAKLRAGKFLEFTPPDTATKRNGSVKFGHLSRRFTLPANDQVDRLTRLGNQLVPPYQKSLAADDPVRIDFHFYSIDGLKLSTCLSTAPGDIFLPSNLLKRLPEDGDLAAILATCVADLLEKQAVMLAPKAAANRDAWIAGTAAGLVVPGLGLATLAGTSIYAEHLEEQLQHQSARVSLDLLADAGYAPQIAPHAEELAEAKHRPLKMNAQVSARTDYLYRALAERERRER